MIYDEQHCQQWPLWLTVLAVFCKLPRLSNDNEKHSIFTGMNIDTCSDFALLMAPLKPDWSPCY